MTITVYNHRRSDASTSAMSRSIDLAIIATIALSRPLVLAQYMYWYSR